MIFSKQKLLTPEEQTLLRFQWSISPLLYKRIDLERRYLSSISSFLERTETHEKKPWLDIFCPTNWELGESREKKEKEKLFFITYIECDKDTLYKNMEYLNKVVILTIRINFTSGLHHCLVKLIDTLDPAYSGRAYTDFPSTRNIISENKDE